MIVEHLDDLGEQKSKKQAYINAKVEMTDFFLITKLIYNYSAFIPFFSCVYSLRTAFY